MKNIPNYVYENAAWFIFYSNMFDMDRIKANNRQSTTTTTPRKKLSGLALAAALKNM